MTRKEIFKLTEALAKISHAYIALQRYRKEHDSNELKFVSELLDEGLHDDSFGLDTICPLIED